jgi:hypothetical protein
MARSVAVHSQHVIGQKGSRVPLRAEHGEQIRLPFD